MGPGGVESFVRLQFLESVKTALLVELVAPFRKELAASGMREDETPGSKQWIMSLFRVLSREDGTLPSGLVSALLTLDALNSEAGRRSLTEHARLLAVDLSQDGEVLTGQDAALYAYIHHPSLFSLAYHRMCPDFGQKFAEFVGKSLPAAGLPSLGAVRELLERWVAGLPFLRFQVARVDQRVDQLVFCFVHEKPLLAIPGQEPNDRSSWPEVCDVIFYDMRTNSLSVSAEYAEHEDLYRAMAGTVLMGDPAYFAAVPVYLATPFFEQGLHALDTCGIEGIDRISLARVRLATGHDPDSWTELGGAVAMAWLEEPRGKGNRCSSGVIKWRFHVFPHRDGPGLLIKVSPPNRLWADCRVHLPQFRKFMLERGFFRLPRPPPR